MSYYEMWDGEPLVFAMDEWWLSYVVLPQAVAIPQEEYDAQWGYGW